MGRRPSTPKNKKFSNYENSAIRNEILKHRKAPGIVNKDSIPPRNTQDHYGELFEGLPADRIKEQALGDHLLMPLRDREGWMPSGGQTRSLPAEFYARREHFFGNTIDDFILGSDDSLDSKRAVGKNHQKTNTTDERILSSGNTDGERAVQANHQKTDSTDERVLGSHNDTNSNARAVREKHIKYRDDGTSGNNADRPFKGHMIKDDEVGLRPIANEVKGSDPDGPDNSVKGLRKLSDMAGAGGTGKIGASKDHAHGGSIHFAMLPRPARQAALALRERIRESTDIPADVRDGLLVLMALAFDDPDATREETEAAIDGDPSHETEHRELWGYNLRTDARFHQNIHPDMQSLIIEEEPDATE